MMRFCLKNFAVAFLVCGVALVPLALACGKDKGCKSCLALDRVKQAAENAQKIKALLKTKDCENWRGLEFRVVAVSISGVSRCRTFTGLPYVGTQQPKCGVAENLDLAVDEEIAVEAGTSVIDDLARDGQLECEPNGTMVFNRGRARFTELDSLFEPSLFRPTGFGIESTKMVGFEVVLSSKLTQYRTSVPEHWCHDGTSAALIFYDVVDNKGISILSEST